MIVAVTASSDSAAEVLRAAFPDETVAVVALGEVRAADDNGSGGGDPGPSGNPVRSVSSHSVASRLVGHVEHLMNHPKLGPFRRLMEEAAREASVMAAEPLSSTSSSAGNQALARVFALLDQDETAAVVCLDRKSELLGWRCAQGRPDRLVLAGAETSIAVLRMLDAAGFPRQPSAVRQQLGPLGVPLGTYPFPELRREGRPRVVSIVSNTIDGDSRVQKVAACLADLGYESILVGRHPTGSYDHFMLGAAFAVRLPAHLASRDYEAEAPPRTPVTALAFRSRGQRRTAVRHAKAQARRLSAEEAFGDLSTRRALSATSARWLIGLRASLFAKNRQRFFALRGDPSIETSGQWRRPMLGDLDHWALADDFELEYGPYVESLRPDIIHAHDSDMLGVAMTVAGRLRGAGHHAQVVYDAHEYTPGTARFHARQSQVLAAVERKYVPRCDAVVTVSDEIADLLTAEHQLDRRPWVVLNAPNAPRGSASHGVRSVIGQPDTTPILVYVGGVAPQRGVDLAVAALPQLPGVHVVVVAPANNQTKKLTTLATALGVADRFHRLDYVPADEVVDFIASCDVGLIPFRPLPNSELGLPTKYREYVLAGLPIVASDQGLIAEGIRATGIGELFPSGDVQGLANAVNIVLANIRGYRSAITPELAADSQWGAQAEVVRKAYAELATPDRRTSKTARVTPSVIIGRIDAAGLATAWARSMEHAGVRSVSLRVTESEYGDFKSDITVRARDWRRDNYRLKAFAELVPRFSHAVIEGGLPLFGVDGLLADIDALQRSGVSTALVFHGADVRRPTRHAQRERWSPFRDPANSRLTRHLHQHTAEIHGQLEFFEGPTFVSTPDLLEDVPWANWLPIVVDTMVFKPCEERTDRRRRPFVIHVADEDGTSGSRHIVPVLERLRSERLLNYCSIEGVSQSAMPDLLRAADVLVDQISMNSIGTLATQAMASGNVVVGHLHGRVRDLYPTAPPVVDATPETLYEVVRALVSDPERRVDLARAGRDYVMDMHDGRLAADILRTALGIPLNPEVAD